MLDRVNLEQEILQFAGVEQCEIRTLKQFVKTDPLAVEHTIICFQRISRQPEPANFNLKSLIGSTEKLTKD